MRHLGCPFCHIKEVVNVKILSSMLGTPKTHPFSLGNYLETSLIIGNLMIIMVTSVEWTWFGLEWHPTLYVACLVRGRYSITGFLMLNVMHVV